ncbi:MAG: vitamin K epoxide reductase family protein [Candidatus Andersenbacteria bacterium]
MRKALFVIAILGLLISGYLYITYTSGGPILCGSGGCEEVRGSAYAHLFGLPTPLYGIIFYVLLGVSAILWTPPWYRRLHFPLLLLTGIGLVVSIWLTYLEAFVIEAWCRWCVVSAVLTLVAFALVWSTLSTNDYDKRD